MGSLDDHHNTVNGNEEEEEFIGAMQIASASLLPMVMKVAIELNLFEIIAKTGLGAQLSPKEIVSQLPTNNPNAVTMVDRILRVLASCSVLSSSVVSADNGMVERRYGLEPICKYFVTNEDGVSLSPYLLMAHDKVFMDSWYHLKDAILEGGIPFNRAHGMSAFEYAETDPRLNQIFNRSMFNHTSIVMKKILETYKGFEGLREVVDVAGGSGVNIGLITSKYPTIKGINFDLPHVIENAPPYPGVEHIGGDMFKSVPKGETIFMKWILHDWSDESCVKVLQNCYKALPDEGKVIIVEGIVPVSADKNNGANYNFRLDVVMMTFCPDGKERTEDEFIALAKSSGFTMKKVCCAYNFWVIEFCKNPNN